MTVPKKTLCNLFINKCSENPNANALGWVENNHIKFLSYSEYSEIVEVLALAIKAQDFSQHDKVAILSTTNKEWHLFDLASMCAGATVIPVYPTYLDEEILYILNHSHSKILIVENEDQFKKFLSIQDKAPNISTIVSIKDVDNEFVDQLNSTVRYFSYGQFVDIGKAEKKAKPGLFQSSTEQVKETDIASIVYTSGTTGEPKGAVITHKAFSSMLNNITLSLGKNVDHNDRALTFLPLSHVLGRCDSYLNLALGLETIYAESIDKIIDNLSLVQPTIMIAVPRIFEKVYAKIMDTLQEGSFTKKKIFKWAKNVSDQYFSYIENDQAPPSKLQIQKTLAYKLVFSKIYERFGGKVRFFVSGGAPLSVDIIKFLRNANLTILEGYGLTETIAPCVANPASKQIIGTVGLPMGDVQIKIADDGEILVKTDAMFTEYYKKPEATQEVIDEDGWFMTGDIGLITKEGYLKITDRKKDIIITSGGKNVAPQKIENMLKTQKFVSQIMVIGDKKKYLTAVIGIEKESFLNVLDQLGLQKTCTIEDLATNDKVKALIQENINEVNEHLAQFETIKKFCISTEEFTIDNGLLTPSLKIKKKVILKKFENEINAMY